MRIAVTGGLSPLSIYYIRSLIEAGFPPDFVFVQSNLYRPNRERKALKEKGISYFIRYLERFFCLKILGLPETFTDFLRCRLRNLLKRRYLRGAKWKDLSLDEFDGDFFHVFRSAKKLFKELGAETQLRIVSDINNKSGTNPLLSSELDILIIIGGGLLKPHVLDAAATASLTIHNTFLPRSRGWGGGEIWALINDDRQALGQTVFYTSNGMDDGDILKQSQLDIQPDDDLESLKTRNIELGKNLLVESVELLSRGKAPRIKQDDSLATYINGHPTSEQIEMGLKNLEKWKRELER